MNNEYLKNDLVKFIPHFELDINKKINIVSSAFFKLEKNGQYKDFSIYVEGIKTTAKFIKENLKGYKFRIFIDNTITSDDDLMKMLTTYDDIIQLVEYKCDKYFDGKNHDGLLGTLIRFFPFFDFPNNDAKDVIVMDIELPDHNVEKNAVTIEALDYIKKKGFDLLWTGTGYFPKRSSYAMAGKVFCFNKFNNEIIINFMEDVDNNKFINKRYLYHQSIKNDNMNYKFIYGTDEVFLNDVLIKNIPKNKYKLGVIFKFTLSYILYDVRKTIIKDKNILNEITNYKKKSLKPYEILNYVDSLFYKFNDKNVTDEMINITKNLYNQLGKMRKLNNYKLFSKKLVDFSLDDLNNVMYAHAISDYHTNEITFIIKSEVVDDKVIYSNVIYDCYRESYENCLKKMKLR